MLVFIVASRIFIALATGSAQESGVIAFPTCDNLLDVLTGCSSLFSIIVSSAIGAIPGAHWAFSAILSTLTNVALLWSVLTLIRGT